ncbi:MAG: hypothetical protein ABI706_13735 [Ilumatobacteraceae bacterium]
MFGAVRGSMLTRSRWAGIGAAIAVSLGAGGIGLIANAAGNSAPSSFVSITPCRLFDTRPATEVGDRNTPLNAGEEFVRPVWGTNGNCTIPTTATGISYNLTVPSGINGFLTVYPSDAARPLVSSINPVTGEGVKANAGIVGLSATGTITVFTLSTADALLDITGYFQPAAGGGTPGTPGAPGAPGAPGTPGLRGPAPWDTIPSGQTVTGSIVYDTHRDPTVDSDTVGVDLPGVAPVALTALTVNFGPGAGIVDVDTACIGSATAPTAPAGKVCIYLRSSAGVDVASLTGEVASVLPTRSFEVDFNPVAPVVGDVDEFIFASWAYTAP